MRLGELTALLDRVLDRASADGWDNPGLLAGDRRRTVRRVLLGLDVSAPLISEARRRRTDLLLVHHPLIFHPLKQVTTDDRVGRLLGRLLTTGIGCYAAHTNLDARADGINHELARALGIVDPAPLERRPGDPAAGHGRWGRLGKPVTARVLLKRARRKLGSRTVRTVGDLDRKIRRVGVSSGAGGEFLEAAIASRCDLYLTGDLKHDRFQDAADAGIVLADLGHAETDWFGFAKAMVRIWEADATLAEIPLVVADRPWVEIARL